ncbi:hypothetical protein F3Y22_tig00003725pilonHSYRG00250 [Hibiscus syriacus]|uniref:Kinesin motor domain-containing protein n=1 Tax=Hibiscus syriacus TaxID=106335 RepID=A0A6A3CL54_HIBSY|nr:hypothetical protein F3Y22_tig00003725pilonHSYRG00250 [Hibiscus syriacus]
MNEEAELIQEQGERIFVSVRVRPLNNKERARHGTSDWECINNDTIVFKSSLPDAYTFDRVFDCDCPTSQVYEEGAKDVALSVHQEREFLVKFSAMEIYNEAVRDLLSSDTTPLRLLDDPERGTVVERLTEETIIDKEHLQELLSIYEG